MLSTILLKLGTKSAHKLLQRGTECWQLGLHCVGEGLLPAKVQNRTVNRRIELLVAIHRIHFLQNDVKLMGGIAKSIELGLYALLGTSDYAGIVARHLPPTIYKHFNDFIAPVPAESIK